MDTQTIILIIGIAMVFIGVFGGGFEIKEIKIPKVNIFSRILGFVVGTVFLLISLDVVHLPSSEKEKEPENVEVQPIKDVEKMEPVDEEDMGNASLQKKIDETKEAWENLSVENAIILEEYNSIKNAENFKDLSITDRSDVLNRIESLEKSVLSLQNYKNSENKITVMEKLQMLDINFGRLSSKNKKYIDEQIEFNNNIIENQAHIKTTNNFVTCEDLRNKEPYNIKNRFPKGKVWIWMRIHSPRNESLRLDWYNLDKNESLKITSLNIKKSSSGYRTFYNKNIQESGNYEARLYNQQKHLVGLRKFTIQ